MIAGEGTTLALAPILFVSGTAYKTLALPNLRIESIHGRLRGDLFQLLWIKGLVGDRDLCGAELRLPAHEIGIP